MDTTTCLLVIAVVMIYYYAVQESFTSQRRAESISSWFSNRIAPSYTAYKRDLPDSNVVEYESALKLYQAGNGTTDNIKQMILQ